MNPLPALRIIASPPPNQAYLTLNMRVHVIFLSTRLKIMQCIFQGSNHGYALNYLFMIESITPMGYVHHSLSITINLHEY